VRKEVRAFEVFRDEISVSFLDRRPVFLGHCLLIPLSHLETLYDLPKNLIGQFFANAQLVGKGVQTAMGANGSLILINNKVSQSVPHLHIHIIPRKVGDHLRGFMWPRRKYESEDQMGKIASSILIAISAASGKTV
jgi:histidine triad (HIT) family protein